jgi:hypothetical protein
MRLQEQEIIQRTGEELTAHGRSGRNARARRQQIDARAATTAEKEGGLRYR